MPTCLRLTYLVVIVVLGCRHDDPYFCENAPHHNCLALDASKGCTIDRDCAAPTAVCDVGGTMTCVECTMAEHEACTASQPACGSDHSCRGCIAHGECPMSLACLPDGSCGTDANVAYVDPGGTDNNVCSFATPCTVVARALATAKPFIKFHGATSEAVSINNQNVTLLADPGAQLTRPDKGLVLEVRGSSQVSIYDLELTAGSGPSGIGISLPAGNTAALELHRARVTLNAGGGISAAGGTVAVSRSTITSNQVGGVSTTGANVTISQSNITSNQGSGVTAMGSTVTISQSMIIGNRGGGVSIMNGTFNVTNNFVADNGDASASAGSDFGGLSLTGSGADQLAFNTIAYNHAKVATLLSAGVACSVTSFVAPDNIITANNEGVTLPVQTKGPCTFGNSYTIPGTSDNTLGFRSISAPLDLHLTAASPASVVDAAGACTGTDIDGDVRPIGAACDLGADERKP